MDRILLLVTVTIIATKAAKAQSVTYNHDSPKQNQVTVMETVTSKSILSIFTFGYFVTNLSILNVLQSVNHRDYSTFLFILYSFLILSSPREKCMSSFSIQIHFLFV